MSWLRTVGLRLLLAFMLSFALWVFVSYTQNPDRRIRFDNVPVEAVGLGPGLIVVDSTGLARTTRPTINISVEGAADDLQAVSERDLRAFQDLTGLGAGQYLPDVKVEPTNPDRVRLQFTPDPVRLSLRIEREITRTAELTVTVSGSVPFSFEALSPRVTVRGAEVTTANVRGPQNRVERVARVRAVADIDRLTSTYNSPRTLEAVDADGRVVDGVTVDPAQIIVQVPIISSVGIKRVPVVPQLSGQAASGFVVAGVSVDPQLVTLTGSSGPLDDVQSISTAPVALSGASATFTQTVDLQEPQSARLRFGEPTQATVVVRIVPLSRPFQVTLPLPVQAVGVEDGLLVSISPAAVPFTLQGSTAALARLDTTQLVATVSVRGLGPGTYTIAPELALPADVRLAGPPPRVTVTLRAPATATPPPPTGEVETPTPGAAPTSPPAATPPPQTPPPQTPVPTAAPAP